MSARAHRWEAGQSPLADHHGGTAAAARAAIKATRLRRLEEFTRAKEVARNLIAKAENESDGAVRRNIRLRPLARSKAQWNCRTDRYHLPRGNKTQVWYPKDKRESIARRLILIEVQRGQCALCGERLSEGDRASDTLRPTIDHVIPRDLGGNNWRNIVIAHTLCNRKKGNDLPTGCEVIWLLAVNALISRLPHHQQKAFHR